MLREDLKVGSHYKWRYQSETLVYLGKHQDHQFCRGWFQFAKVEDQTKVWCEVRAEDLANIDAIPSEATHGITKE
jgi:hypothetical protein